MSDEAGMRRAMELAAAVRTSTSTNPWVGAVLDCAGERVEGAIPLGDLSMRTGCPLQ